jgi:hypothetical protein
MKKLFGKNKGEEHNFWMSYTDLMSGFLIVFIIGCIISAKYNAYVSDTDVVIPKDSLITLKNEKQQMEDTLRNMTSRYALLEQQFQQFQRIHESVKNIDTLYFKYDSSFDRHTLHNVSVSFNRESANIQDISAVDRNKLLDVGRSILTFVDSAVSRNANIKYLLIIEGQSSRDNYDTNEYRNNDVLSYRRALSLKNFWSRNNLRFNDGKCEIIISGSGQSSQFRVLPDTPTNRANQRFVIHIIPKIGNLN